MCSWHVVSSSTSVKYAKQEKEGGDGMVTAVMMRPWDGAVSNFKFCTLSTQANICS